MEVPVTAAVVDADTDAAAAVAAVADDDGGGTSLE